MHEATLARSRPVYKARADRQAQGGAADGRLAPGGVAGVLRRMVRTPQQLTQA